MSKKEIERLEGQAMYVQGVLSGLIERHGLTYVCRRLVDEIRQLDTDTTYEGFLLENLADSISQSVFRYNRLRQLWLHRGGSDAPLG